MTPSDDYVEMKAFLRFFSERFLDARTASASDRPLAVLERQEQASPAEARSGLRMAVNNCMEISSSWPLSQVMALDAEMHAKGVPSLSQVRSRVWGRYRAMLKRGQVRSADELAVAQGVLADRSLAPEMPEAERLALQAMVQAFGKAGALPARPSRPLRGAPVRR